MRINFYKIMIIGVLLIATIASVPACKKSESEPPASESTGTTETPDGTDAGQPAEKKAKAVDEGIPAEYPYPAVLPDTEKGKLTYVENCESCHGLKGDAIKQAPFASAEAMREKRPFELFQTITNGRGSMPSWKNRIEEQSRWDALYYVWTFHSTTEQIDAGLVAYGTYCAPCHGVNGDGQGSQAIAEQLKPASFSDLKWMNGQKDSFMALQTRQGAGLMPSFSEDLMEDQILSVIDFVRTFSYGPKSETKH